MVWADEPTGNLDSESTAAVMALFKRLNGEGQTIVMVTHDPLIAAAAGRTVRMRDGQIDDTGPAAGAVRAEAVRAEAVRAGSAEPAAAGQVAGAKAR